MTPQKYVVAKRGDTNKINEWYDHCKKLKLPYIIVELRTKYADVRFDYISLPTEHGKHIDKNIEQITDKAIQIFNKYANKKSKYSINGFSMGTSYHITYLLGQEHNYQYEVDSILSEINNSLSTYLPNSTISIINQTDSIAKIDNHFIKVYLKAVDIYNKTKGAFNPTIMPLVNAWGFGFDNRENVNKIRVIKRCTIMKYIV